MYDKECVICVHCEKCVESVCGECEWYVYIARSVVSDCLFVVGEFGECLCWVEYTYVVNLSVCKERGGGWGVGEKSIKFKKRDNDTKPYWWKTLREEEKYKMWEKEGKRAKPTQAYKHFVCCRNIENF